VCTIMCMRVVCTIMSLWLWYLYALLFLCFGVVFLHLNVHISCQNFHFFQRWWATKKQRKQRQIHRYTALTDRYTARTDRCTAPNRLYRRLVLNFWICAVLSGIPPVLLGIPLPRVGGTPLRFGRANPGCHTKSACITAMTEASRSSSGMTRSLTSAMTPHILHRVERASTYGDQQNVVALGGCSITLLCYFLVTLGPL
jgi:hypothetical protein